MNKENEKLIKLEKECLEQREKCMAIESKPYSPFRTPSQTKKLLVDSNSIFANSDKLEFVLNLALTGEKYKSNDFIKNIVFDVVANFSEFCFERGKRKKLCVWITQFLPVTKTGTIRSDVDNADHKGIIDGVVQALKMDDNGLNISLHSEILPLCSGSKPYTRIIVVCDELIREIIEQI